MEKIITDVWTAIGPQVVAFVASAVGLIAAWALLQLRAKLKVDTETGLAGSLYRSIENGLKATLSRRLQHGSSVGPEVTGSVVKEVLDYTKANNPKAVTRLDQTDAALVDKIQARLPEAKAAVVEAAAKVEAAAVGEATTRPLA